MISVPFDFILGYDNKKKKGITTDRYDNSVFSWKVKSFPFAFHQNELTVKILGGFT